MKNLKEIYAKELLYYWCNLLGEINVPGTERFSSDDPEELPPKQKILYEGWQWEDDPYRRVVSYDGKAAMALELLFDYSWLADIMTIKERNFCARAMGGLLFQAIQKYGQELEARLPNVDILVGEDTDPDGHELLVIVPFDERSRIEEIALEMGDAYSCVEREVFSLCCAVGQIGQQPHSRFSRKPGHQLPPT